ncbi:LysR family transcriptional regulator [Paraburkholderia sp. 40]|uniref:LysR family transcriptional regulator n=1 Tax=Paraburkholderia sp. 40 TaxID=2991059 RepID=UPI003D1C85F7
MMDDFTRIQTFIKVVEAGSFSAAARCTDSSISAVARQVQSLEEELCIRLLNRSTRSLSLTEPGRIFFERVRTISKDLSNAKSEATSFQESVKGVLRVSLRVSTGTTIIVPALPRLVDQYPELGFDISLTDERPDLIANNIDVAVWMGHIPDAEIVARRLTRSERIVCASPSYFERHGVPKTPEDLRHHNCLLYAARSYGNIWEFTKDDTREDIEVNGNLRSDNGLVLISAAIAGIGILVAQEWTVRLPVSRGELARMMGDYTVRPRAEDSELYVVYPNSRGLSRKVRIFVDFLVHLFKGADSLVEAPRLLADGPPN